MEPTYINLMRISRVDRSRLMCRLDDQIPESRAGSRAEERASYRAEELPLIVRHPGGSTGRFLVCARDLSSGGMGFLHGGYIHARSECRLVLRKRDGSLLGIDSIVRHCKHVDGHVHEIGVEFLQRVDISEILDPSLASADVEAAQSMLPQIKGKLLYVEDSELEQRLMAHVLGKTSLDLKTVPTSGAALDAMRLARFDLVLCDLHLEDSDSIPLIAEMRNMGYRGPILLVTAEEDAVYLARARSAGANEIIGKPYGVEMLISLLAEWLEAPPIDNALFSSMESMPGMADMVVDFIDRAIKAADAIAHGQREGDFELIRTHCLMLQGAGAGFGFESVSAAACNALRSFESNRGTNDALESMDAHLRRLSQLIGRLRCSTSARPVGR